MTFKNFGFYFINPKYLEYLNSIDSEVYYNSKYDEKIKPFIGIIVFIDGINYFIPLSSAKVKHKKWKNVSKNYFLIYEKVNKDNIFENNIYKPFSEDEKLHILALLDLRKMIPAPETEVAKVDFSAMKNWDYKKLLMKEYDFCLKNKTKIEYAAKELYNNQKKTGKVQRFHCNFHTLEEAMYEWIEKNKGNNNLMMDYLRGCDE